MKCHQTKLQKENDEQPTPLDLKRIIGKRSIIPDLESASSLNRLEVGESGEEKVLKAFKEYGKDHWIVLRNIWLNEFGAFECDLILLTSYCIYMLEVKNYTGTLTYENGVCRIYKKKLPKNPISQAQRAYLNLKSICESFPRHVNVKGAIVFIGENNKVTINSPVEDIEVIRSNELYDFIQTAAYEEKYFNYQPLDRKALIKHFENHETSNLFPAEPLNNEQLKNIRPGIYCCHCGSYDLKISRKVVKCGCGMHEPRDEAIVRSICDYGVLHFDKHLTAKAIIEFLDHQFSRNVIVTILNKYFTAVIKGKYTYYLNKKRPYQKIKAEFRFTAPKIFYLNEDDYIILKK